MESTIQFQQNNHKICRADGSVGWAISAFTRVMDALWAQRT
jgi:hypothetical protein